MACRHVHKHIEDIKEAEKNANLMGKTAEEHLKHLKTSMRGTTVVSFARRSCTRKSRMTARKSFSGAHHAIVALTAVRNVRRSRGKLDIVKSARGFPRCSP